MDNNRDLLLIESLLKIAAISKLLVKKGIITDEEIVQEMNNISKDLIEQMKLIAPEVLSTIN